MSNFSDMRKKIDAMRIEREAWTERMRQIDADREARKIRLEKSGLNRIKSWFFMLFDMIRGKIAS
ncbi:hypothetical protein IQ260_22900 [Leptolyngbya cf. ectocarpi LEGE 11479]|uniref:Uncharacterized protein n=1 Tax=Leptolyngbya cf. ectocarpi LEGE 11479 TaxID=1828722 RepID=A0A928ZXV1_LEPEC|nr:hypothetical protein [Leptolyngbya ectocarpi]MBE9069499.1 hypothetical protein [Leptolyngbya cf. ectocarpi LEGE 11479]